MELKARDRVYIIDSAGAALAEGSIVNINDFREPEMKYAVDIDGYHDNPVFLGKEKIIKVQEDN